LTFNSGENPIDSSSISPDGKYLAYSDPAGIHVKLLSNGDERLIPRPAGVPASAGWHLESWFPDGTQLLARASEPGGHGSFWTVSMIGQSPRVLREGVSGYGAVSPDGTHIALVRFEGSGHGREISVMSIQGDNPQKILTFGENEWLKAWCWSADGQRLAYIRKWRASEDFQQSMETCDLKGNDRRMLVPGSDLYLGDLWWLPDGRIVYSRQEFPGSDDFNLWQIGINTQTGARTGKPKRITQWGGSYITQLSASADGKRLTFAKRTPQGQVYVGGLPAGAAEGRGMSAPRRLTNDEYFDASSAWTTDSKAVLFFSNRNGTWGIFKQGISQETAEAVVAGGQAAILPRLTSDGASILYLEVPKTLWFVADFLSMPSRLMRIPVSGGVPQLVLETKAGPAFGCASAPASLCVVLEASQDAKHLTVTAFDPLKGRGKLLRAIERDPSATCYVAALSPDGSTFALSKCDEPEIHIRLFSLSGDSDREITVKGWPNLRWNGLYWSPDGKGLFCGSNSPRGGTILYVDLKGNARVLWHFEGSSPVGSVVDVGSIWGIPSPDGRYLAIESMMENCNVWMLEGF
jgi:Tol biopolymer transport system component